MAFCILVLADEGKNNGEILFFDFISNMYECRDNFSFFYLKKYEKHSERWALENGILF